MSSRLTAISTEGLFPASVEELANIASKGLFGDLKTFERELVYLGGLVKDLAIRNVGETSLKASFDDIKGFTIPVGSYRRFKDINSAYVTLQSIALDYELIFGIDRLRAVYSGTLEQKG